jgi:2-polyprenyl-3-methyl-5-hydroxy-6-metoxy-1,4-benzoquinol methylase
VTSHRSLAQRRLVPEVMDDPALDPAKHEHALKSLSRINFFSTSAAIVWPAIRRLAIASPSKQLRVLDIGSGAGDVPLALWRKAKRAGLNIEFSGVDLSARAVEFARARAARASAPIRFEQQDALADHLPEGHDIVMCSLFLHHLTVDDARRVIGNMAAAARQLVLISDLRRSNYGWYLAYIASRVLTRSEVVHIDAVRSVEAAFSMSELRELAATASLADVTVVPRWPCRMLLTGPTATANQRVVSS